MTIQLTKVLDFPQSYLYDSRLCALYTFTCNWEAEVGRRHLAALPNECRRSTSPLQQTKNQTQLAITHRGTERQAPLQAEKLKQDFYN